MPQSQKSATLARYLATRAEPHTFLCILSYINSSFAAAPVHQATSGDSVRPLDTTHEADLHHYSLRGD